MPHSALPQDTLPHADMAPVPVAAAATPGFATIWCTPTCCSIA
jgi:hypothetical protein